MGPQTNRRNMGAQRDRVGEVVRDTCDGKVEMRAEKDFGRVGAGHPARTAVARPCGKQSCRDFKGLGWRGLDWI